MNDRIIDHALTDFPDHLLSDDGMKALRSLFKDLGIEFAPCGVDDENRLIVCSDDGSVVAYDLDSADPGQKTIGVKQFWRLNADTEYIGGQQFAESYMLDRDVSDWVWVHPQWRYLTSDPLV